MLRLSGSEVMGLMEAGCRLAPTGDSLKTYDSGPSSSQPFSYCPHFTMSADKSQMFSQVKNTFSFQHNFFLARMAKNSQTAR